LDPREPRGFLLTRGCQLEVAGRFGNIPRKNVRGNGDSSRRNFGEFVRLLVALAGYVVKLDAIELVFEGSYGIAVCLHLVVVTTHVFHDLVDHELRVSPNVEALDARLNGDFEAAEEGLVLRHVVQRGKM
jgi:hypothetical protein